MSKKPPRVDSFRDYREFLEARFIWEKKQNSSFSYQFCASRLKLTKGYLNRVINKQRHLGLDHVMPLARLFKLNEREQQYLLFLMLLGNSRERSIRKLFQSILARVGANIEVKPSQSFEPETEGLWSDWVCTAVFGLVPLKGFSSDPQWMCNKFGGEAVVSRARVEKAWNWLLKQGLVEERDGKFTRREVGFQQFDPFDLNSEFVFKPILQKALEDVKIDDLQFSRHALILTINDREREEIQAAYRNFHAEIMRIAGGKSESPDSVYFVSNNFFQVTRDYAQDSQLPVSL
jgi:uncharacterized protein (TIGR02147 family)